MPDRSIKNLGSLFDEVVILKKKTAAEKDKKTPIRKGNFEIRERCGNCETQVRNRLLEQSNEAARHNRITKQQALMIQTERNKKGWSQKYLANQIGEKPDVITQYENGKAIINNKIITKLERKLNIKLRNKK